MKRDFSAFSTLAALLTLMIACSSVVAFTAQNTVAEVRIPDLSGPVIDDARILAENERLALASELYGYQPKIQIQVWIVTSLEGEPIESLSIRAAEKWKLGSKKEGNGLLVLVAVQDRRMRIEVGQGIEDRIPDAIAFQVIDRMMVPEFRAGKYYDGIANATRYLKRRIAGESVEDLPTAKQSQQRRPTFSLFVLIFLFVVVSTVIRIFDRVLSGSNPLSRSRRLGGGWGGGGWGGGGGFGGGGGGGWSGGGGGFSGGGSSGGW